MGDILCCPVRESTACSDPNMDYGIETDKYRKIVAMISEVSQTPSPHVQVTTHLSIRQHTAVHPQTLMMAITQMGTSTLPVIALHEADPSVLPTQYRAIALAHVVIRAIYNGDIAKPTFLMAETAGLKDELNTAFFNMGQLVKREYGAGGRECACREEVGGFDGAGEVSGDEQFWVCVGEVEVVESVVRGGGREGKG
jgi:hypothetical protein